MQTCGSVTPRAQRHPPTANPGPPGCLNLHRPWLTRGHCAAASKQQTASVLHLSSRLPTSVLASPATGGACPSRTAAALAGPECSQPAISLRLPAIAGLLVQQLTSSAGACAAATRSTAKSVGNLDAAFLRSTQLHAPFAGSGRCCSSCLWCWSAILYSLKRTTYSPATSSDCHRLPPASGAALLAPSASGGRAVSSEGCQGHCAGSCSALRR